MKKRLLASLLSLCLLFGLLPTAALAAGNEGYTLDSNLAVKLGTGSVSKPNASITDGDSTWDYVYLGGLKWRVLSTEGSSSNYTYSYKASSDATENTTVQVKEDASYTLNGEAYSGSPLFLLAEDVYEFRAAFHASRYGHEWEGKDKGNDNRTNDLYKYLNGEGTYTAFTLANTINSGEANFSNPYDFYYYVKETPTNFDDSATYYSSDDNGNTYTLVDNPTSEDVSTYVTFRRILSSDKGDTNTNNQAYWKDQLYVGYTGGRQATSDSTGKVLAGTSAEKYNFFTENGAWSELEKNNILGTTKTSGYTSSSKFHTGVGQGYTITSDYQYYGGSLAGDKLFPLSPEEVMDPSYGLNTVQESNSNNPPSAARKANVAGTASAASWWLRASFNAHSPGLVSSSGALHNALATITGVGVRPALNFNPESVLFASSASKASGTSASGASESNGAEGAVAKFSELGTALTGNTGNTWQLTMKDESITAPTSAFMTDNEDGTVTIYWSGASFGESKGEDYSNSVSAVLMGTSGEDDAILGYVRLGSTESGSATVALPNGVTAEDAAIKVFAEQTSSQSNMTDFASEFSEELEVGKLASIEAVANEGANTTYAAESTFDTSTITVTATYTANGEAASGDNTSLGTAVLDAEDYTVTYAKPDSWEGDDPTSFQLAASDASGKQKVTLSYQEKTCEFEVTVTGIAQAAPVLGIEAGEDGAWNITGADETMEYTTTDPSNEGDVTWTSVDETNNLQNLGADAATHYYVRYKAEGNKAPGSVATVTVPAKGAAAYAVTVKATVDGEEDSVLLTGKTIDLIGQDGAPSYYNYDGGASVVPGTYKVQVNNAGSDETTDTNVTVTVAEDGENSATILFVTAAFDANDSGAEDIQTVILSGVKYEFTAEIAAMNDANLSGLTFKGFKAENLEGDAVEGTGEDGITTATTYKATWEAAAEAVDLTGAALSVNALPAGETIPAPEEVTVKVGQTEAAAAWTMDGVTFGTTEATQGQTYSYILTVTAPAGYAFTGEFSGFTLGEGGGTLTKTFAAITSNYAVKVSGFDAGDTLTYTAGGINASASVDETGNAVLTVPSTSTYSISITDGKNVTYTGSVQGSSDTTYPKSNMSQQAPKVTVTPAGTGIPATTKDIVLTFDQAMKLGTGGYVTVNNSYSYLLKESDLATEDYVTTVTIPVKSFLNGSTPLTLSNGSTYTVAMSAGALVSANGREDKGLASALRSQFSVAGTGSGAAAMSFGATPTAGGSVVAVYNNTRYTGSFNATAGETVTFTATERVGYKLTGWTVYYDGSTNLMDNTMTAPANQGLSLNEAGNVLTYTVPATQPRALDVRANFVLDGETEYSIDIDEDSQDVTIQVNGSKSISYTVEPVGSTVSWTSEDTGVATVSGGTVYGIAPGETTVTATMPDGTTKATVKVKVVAAATRQPDLTTEAATGIGSATVTLNGTVEANGNTVVEAGFRIKTFGGAYVEQKGEYDAETRAVTADLTTLSPYTTYYYHTYVKTAAGTYYENNTGKLENDMSFRTTTLDDTDVTAPTITGTEPQAGGVIPVEGSFTVTFSKAMTGTPRVTEADSAELNEDGTELTVAYSGLEYSTAYTFAISGITDRAGNRLVENEVAYTTEEQPADTYADILSATLTIEGTTYTGAVTENAVSFTVPHGTNVTDLAPGFTLSDGASIAPDMAQDFSNGSVTYTVTAADGKTTKEYAVSVAVAEENAYLVSVAETEHGTVTVDPVYGMQDAEIKVVVKPDTGYELANLYYSYEDVTDAKITDGKFPMPASNVTVTATFEAIEYSITYQGMEGASNSNASSYTVEDLPLTLTAPTKDGYTFVGWTGEGISTPTETLTLAEGTTGDKTYTANWSENPAPALSISADRTSLIGGGTVTLTVRNATGDVNVTCDNGISVSGSGETWTANLPNSSATYTFTATDGDSNTASCTVTVSRYTSGGGGGGGSSSGSTTYAVGVDSGKNGSVSVSPKNASKGATVTITVAPKDGYELDDLTVTDKNGGAVKLTRKSDTQYTFTMPSSKVTVEASFVKAASPDVPAAPSFADVPANAYYADAVAWAVENGITSGTSDTTFSPNASCTRAQMVTFLWRAAGSPKAAGANPFTDLDPSAYYYDAVLWAAEQGITSGTSATTFSPNATLTRGQTVTFLYRASGSPAASGNSFADVASGAYYANAVAWAVREGVTSGTGNNAFSPDADCTRAQIVTFMFRAAQ